MDNFSILIFENSVNIEFPNIEHVYIVDLVARKCDYFRLCIEQRRARGETEMPEDNRFIDNRSKLLPCSVDLSSLSNNSKSHTDFR